MLPGSGSCFPSGFHTGTFPESESKLSKSPRVLEYSYDIIPYHISHNVHIDTHTYRDCEREKERRKEAEAIAELRLH